MTKRSKRRILMTTAFVLVAGFFVIQGVDRQQSQAGSVEVFDTDAHLLGYGCRAEALGGPTLGKAAKIKAYGYSIRPIKTWKSIPAQPGEKVIVGGWSPDMEIAMRRGDYSQMGSELQILRFDLQGGVTKTAETDENKKKREDAEEELKKNPRLNDMLKRLNPKSVDEWLEARYENASKRYVPQKIKAGKGKLQGRLIEMIGGRTAYCIAVFQSGGFEWGVAYTCPEEYYKKTWQKIFKKSIKSFQLIKVEGRVERQVSLKDLKKMNPAKRRAALKQGIKGNPGWYAIDSKNYVFLSNSKNKAFIRKLSKDIEAIRAAVYEKMFPPEKEVTTVCTVRVLSTQAEYHQYGGPQGSAGYWNSQKEELVLFDEFNGLGKKKSRKATRSVMFHEAFHQYIFYAIGNLAPHSWFNEGHGDYFAGANILGRKVTMKKFDWRTDYLKQLLRDDGKSLIPIRSLVRMPQSEFYSNAGMKYSQGWALVYYLREVTKNKRWQQSLDIYFKHLSENVAAFKKKKKEEEEDDEGGKSGPAGDLPGLAGITFVDFEDQEKIDKILSEAVDKAFEGIDLEALDKSFQRWVDSL